MSQGHFVFHFAYAIIIQLLVKYEDEESYTCFKFNEDEASYVIEEGVIPEINYVVNAVKYIHFICFICMIYSETYVPLKISTCSHVTKMFFGFVTVPLYIFSILWLMSVQDRRKFRFTEDSTPTDYKV